MSNKSYKAECPKCGHESLYVTPNNGMSYCFRSSCHYLEKNGKSLTQVRKRSENILEIRALYTDLANYYHNCLDQRATEYLIKRGFTMQTIQQFKIGYCPKGKNPKYRSDIAKDAGVADYKDEAFLEDRVIFPYFVNDTTVTDLRGRALDSDDEIRYKSPYGDAFYRGAIYPYNYHLIKNARRISITEGEIKSDIATQENEITLGLPGIASWRSGFVQQEDQEVIIVFDNERKPSTQKDIIYAIRRIIPKLYEPKIATLPFTGNENKAEIDTFILKHGIDMYRSILDNALHYTDWNRLQAF